MISAAELLTGRVRDALSESTWSIESMGGAGWRLASDCREPAFVRARISGRWLLLESTPVDAKPGLALLERNSELAGFAKLARAPASEMLHARGELLLDDDLDLPTRVNDTLDGIAAARGSDVGHRGIRPPAASREAKAPLADICRASGWTFVERQASRLAVDLGLRDLFPRVRVEGAAETGAVRVYAEIDVLPAIPPEPCRSAIAAFLLRAAAVVRLVRPVAVWEQGRLRIGFEAGHSTAPRPVELARALSALSVACELSGREVPVLSRDESIARVYLGLDERADSARHAQAASTS